MTRSVGRAFPKAWRGLPRRGRARLWASRREGLGSRARGGVSQGEGAAQGAERGFSDRRRGPGDEAGLHWKTRREARGGASLGEVAARGLPK